MQLVDWGIGGGISGLAGVLVTPLLGKIDTTTLVVFTVQALAAALVGRLSSLPLTFAGGLALGVTQPVLTNALSGFPGIRGVNELTALAFVLGALLLFPRSGRKDVSSGGLAPVPVLPLPRAGAAIGLACAYFTGTLADAGVPDLLTVPFGIALGVFLGVLIELSVRPVRGTLTRTIVTLGWLLFL